MATFIFCFALIICAAFFITKGDLFYPNDLKGRIIKSIFVVVPASLIEILVSTVVIIPANTVGIIYSPFNGVREETLTEGWHTKNVFDRVYRISTEIKTQKLEKITGQTKDSQWLNIGVDVKYKVDPTNAFLVFRQFKTLKNMNEALIPPAVQRSIESITTQYNIIEILGSSRNAVYNEIEQDLKDRLNQNGVIFHSITFTDTDAGEAIEEAIQKEAIAKKAVETAEQEKARVAIEAQQKTVQAQAEQDAARIQSETKIIQAEAESQIVLIQAKAEADANKAISDSITPSLLQWKTAEARLKHGWITVQGSQAIVDTR